MSRIKGVVSSIARPFFEAPADVIARQHREEVASYERSVAVREAEIQRLNARIDALRSEIRAGRMRVGIAIEMLETSSVCANTRTNVLRILKKLP